MIRSPWRRRALYLSLALGFGLSLVVLLGASGRPSASVLTHEELILVHERCRTGLEHAVIVLQPAAVLAFVLAQFAPANRWARRGRFALVAAMMILGIAGILCAAYTSEFALFAGGTLSVLLILGSLGTARPEAQLQMTRMSADQNYP